MKKQLIFLFLIGAVGLLLGSCSGSSGTIYGRWAYVPGKSTDLVTWRYRVPEVVIQKENNSVAIVWNWIRRKKVAFKDSLAFVPDGAPSKISVTSPIWPENWYMGVLSKTNATKEISGKWKHPNKELLVTKKQTVEISQGETEITTNYSYSLGAKGQMLTVTEKRSSRPTSVRYVFKRIE